MSTVLGRHDRAKEASGASWSSRQKQKPTIEDFPFDNETPTSSGIYLHRRMAWMKG